MLLARLPPHRARARAPGLAGSSLSLGCTSSMMHAASSTSRTPAGGFCIARTSTTSFLLRFASDASAASSAGSAASSSRCAESGASGHGAGVWSAKRHRGLRAQQKRARAPAIALAAAACSLASRSCASTASFVAAASSLSAAMAAIMRSTSAAVAASTGDSSRSARCISSTCAAVLVSLPRPASRRPLAALRPERFSASSAWKVDSSSR